MSLIFYAGILLPATFAILIFVIFLLYHYNLLPDRCCGLEKKSIDEKSEHEQYVHAGSVRSAEEGGEAGGERGVADGSSVRGSGSSTRSRHRHNTDNAASSQASRSQSLPHAHRRSRIRTQSHDALSSSYAERPQNGHISKLPTSQTVQELRTNGLQRSTGRPRPATRVPDNSSSSQKSAANPRTEPTPGETQRSLASAAQTNKSYTKPVRHTSGSRQSKPRCSSALTASVSVHGGTKNGGMTGESSDQFQRCTSAAPNRENTDYNLATLATTTTKFPNSFHSLQVYSASESSRSKNVHQKPQKYIDQSKLPNQPLLEQNPNELDIPADRQIAPTLGYHRQKSAFSPATRSGVSFARQQSVPATHNPGGAGRGDETAPTHRDPVHVQFNPALDPRMQFSYHPSGKQPYIYGANPNGRPLFDAETSYRLQQRTNPSSMSQSLHAHSSSAQLTVSSSTAAHTLNNPGEPHNQNQTHSFARLRSQDRTEEVDTGLVIPPSATHNGIVPTSSSTLAGSGSRNATGSQFEGDHSTNGRLQQFSDKGQSQPGCSAPQHPTNQTQHQRVQNIHSIPTQQPKQQVDVTPVPAALRSQIYSPKIFMPSPVYHVGRQLTATSLSQSVPGHQMLPGYSNAVSSSRPTVVVAATQAIATSHDASLSQSAISPPKLQNSEATQGSDGARAVAAASENNNFSTPYPMTTTLTATQVQALQFLPTPAHYRSGSIDMVTTA